jgi:hypothetical protein
MYNDKYCELIDQVNAKVGVKNPISPCGVCDLHIDGIAITLLHGGEVDEDSLYIYCDFGEPPATLKTQAAHRFMQPNLYLFGNNTPNIGFNTETGRALLMNRMAISQTTLCSLMSALANIALYAHVWSENGFLVPSLPQQMPGNQIAPRTAL